jgi:hypothetical protein
MNPNLKLLLIAGGAAFLFRDQLGAMFPNLFPFWAPEAEPSGAASPEREPAPEPGTTASSAATTKTLLLNAAKKDPAYKANNGLLNTWQWQYYYAQVRGVDPDLQWEHPERLMTLDEWWTGLSAAGLSGARSGQPAAPVRISAARRAWRY